MTKLSRRNLDPRDFGYYINNLWSVFTLLDSKEQVRSLFHDLFTHTEYKMFAKRFEIGRRLIDGQTYEEIGEKLKVTNHTIATVSNILASEGVGMRAAHEKLKKLEKAHKQQPIYPPRYKQAPRISELARDGISGINKIVRKAIRKNSVRKDL